MKCYEIAARWWAERLRTLSPTDFYSCETACPEKLMGLAFQRAKEQIPSEEALASFEKTLSDKIEEYLSKNEAIILSTEYAPDDFLLEAAKTAGISSEVFPWRVAMLVVKGGEVAVKAGPNKVYENIA